jgi:hypothetical protein
VFAFITLTSGGLLPLASVKTNWKLFLMPKTGEMILFAKVCNRWRKESWENAQFGSVVQLNNRKKLMARTSSYKCSLLNLLENLKGKRRFVFLGQ